ncbi:Diaminopimelate decarboxylase [Tribonema minus]|uniref:Diaminopimelate decarboxylase n=1 Tax=Tribonema minus TaxID=303371 RepID=A0A836CNA0_9STRA|nr:Diaminopimelate decarboxylase [Tribonema minus]
MHPSDSDLAASSAPPAPATHYDTSRHDEWAGAVEGVVRAAVSQLNLGSDECPAVELIDAAVLDAQIASLKAAFPDNWLHAYAIKANPLKGVLARVRAAGLGAECASREELLHARRCGFPARALVKFGEALEPARIDDLVGLYRRHAWLTCVHCHVGSQGCSTAMLVTGVRAAVDFARRVNAAVARRQVVVIDIGGGLCTNYRSNEPAMAGMSFADYAASLRATVPELFTGEFEVITEFGRSIVAKAGVTLSCVAGLKSCGGVPTAVLHTGANQFVRQAYRPAEWFQRLSVFGRDGAVRRCIAARPMVPHNVAGPLCFSGDLLARALPLPQVAAGDIICIHDTGAYCTSMYSMYNSRTPLPVYLVARSAPPQPGARSDYCFTPIKVQSTAQTLAFWE